MTTFTHLTTISLALHVDHEDITGRGGPCPFFVLLLPWQTLCQFEHAKRFYCCLLNSGKNSLSATAASHFVMSPRLHVEIVNPEARRFLCTFRPNISTQFDFACHTGQVVNFYECKWRVFLRAPKPNPTMRYPQPTLCVLHNWPWP